MPDCALYNPVWFIQQHLGVAASPLDRLPRIVAWSGRMKALGNGKRKDITATEALDIAKSAKPAATSVDAGDPPGGNFEAPEAHRRRQQQIHRSIANSRKSALSSNGSCLNLEAEF